MLAWHRLGFQLYWRWKSQAEPAGAFARHARYMGIQIATPVDRNPLIPRLSK